MNNSLSVSRTKFWILKYKKYFGVNLTEQELYNTLYIVNNIWYDSYILTIVHNFEYNLYLYKNLPCPNFDIFIDKKIKYWSKCLSMSENDVILIITRYFNIKHNELKYKWHIIMDRYLEENYKNNKTNTILSVTLYDKLLYICEYLTLLLVIICFIWYVNLLNEN